MIAVGGVYKHLEGSLKGKLEASNYASSFISAIYKDRRVPDVCGLVGQLPNADYIMLPVPQGSSMDRTLSRIGDQTQPNDAWAAFSGTSSAAPQLAGACALLEEFIPRLAPLKIKQIIKKTAGDILEGKSNSTSGGRQARAGPDLATGYGLAMASKAIELAKTVRINLIAKSTTLSDNSQTNKESSSLGRTYDRYTSLKLNRRQIMQSQFPKVKASLDEIYWRLDETLQQAMQDLNIEAEVELKIGEENFVKRSPVTKIVSDSRADLKDCIAEDGTISLFNIKKRHVFSAQVLLSLGKYQETALKILTKALTLEVKDQLRGNNKRDYQAYIELKVSPPVAHQPKEVAYKNDKGETEKFSVSENHWKSHIETDNFIKMIEVQEEIVDEIRDKASEALAKYGTEIADFNSQRSYETTDLYHKVCIDGTYYKEWNGQYIRTDEPCNS